MRCFFLLSFLFLVQAAIGQEFYTVVAKSGLSLRSEPSQKAERLGSVEFASELRLIARSGTSDRIKDGKQTLSGEWVKVAAGSTEGYVFDAYLMPKAGSSSDWYEECDPYQACHTAANFGGFTVTFYNYQTEGAEEILQKGDTIELYEYVFNDISLKLGEIELHGADSVAVFSTQRESIYSVEAYHLVKDGMPNRSTEEFRWTGKMPYEELEQRNGFFVVSHKAIDLHKKRMTQFGMTPANVDLGEGWIDANCQMEDKLCVYAIDDVLFRFMPYKNGVPGKEKILKIVLFYGC